MDAPTCKACLKFPAHEWVGNGWFGGKVPRWIEREAAKCKSADIGYIEDRNAGQ